MLQSWDNFMSPSGGSMENNMEFGLSSLVIDFGSSLVNKHVFEPMRKTERAEVVRRIRSKENIITARGTRVRAPYEHAFSIEDIKNPHTNPTGNTRRIASRVSAIDSRYAGLKAGSKAIGWGYLALAAASIMEGLVTPGLSASGSASNEQMMSGGPLDSSQAYTQRQRALMAIHDSQMGARNVFGSEAALLHR